MRHHLKSILRFAFHCLFYPASRLFLAMERISSFADTHYWIRNTPRAVFQGVALECYTNWMHYQGYFSALLDYLCTRRDLKILDFGCGMGKYAPVSQFHTSDGGEYLGIDVDPRVIGICRKAYGHLKNCRFHLSEDPNSFYHRAAAEHRADWPVEAGSQDVVISVSVFTHLQEREAHFYMEKVYDVLKPGGMAFITFLVMREHDNPHTTFHFKHQLTPGWFTSFPECPEQAIAVDKTALLGLIKDKFAVLKWIEGSLTGGRDSMSQDLLVMVKK